jgi:hypothetical protein
MRTLTVSILVLSWFIIGALPVSAKTLQCERYTVHNNVKADWTIFRFELDQDASLLRYRRISGPEWSLPSGSKLKPFWVSPDQLRVVATWLASDYGTNQKQWSPVYILDIDFSHPRYELKSLGGFADFDTVISSPWRQECVRVD